MAILKSKVSDKSKTVMGEGEGAHVRVTFYDGKTPGLKADLTTEEVNEILGKFSTQVSERPNGRGPRKEKENTEQASK